MYIKEGICYAGELATSLEVVSIRALDGYQMLVEFSNGETRMFDASVLTAPVFEPLKDITVLRNVGIECGAPSWLNGTIDVAPEFVYQHSVEYSGTPSAAEDATAYK